MTPPECGHWIDLEVSDARVVKYLKCETLEVSPELENGWYIVGVHGHALGWGKVSGGTLKINIRRAGGGCNRRLDRETG